MRSFIPDVIIRGKKLIKRRSKVRRSDVVIVSPAKSGRTWLAVMISRVYQIRYGIPEHEIIRFDNFQRINPNIPNVAFSHDNQKDRRKRPMFRQQDLQGRRTLLLVRDPRDVSVSSFFQTRRNEGWSPVDQPPIFDYVMHSKLPQVIAFLKRWEEQLKALDHTLLVRYEDLRADPEGELSQVMNFIDGQPPKSDEIQAAVEFAAFENLRQKEATDFFGKRRLRPGDAGDPNSYKVRRGKVGGYRDYFDEFQLAKIEAVIEAAELDAFGYHSNFAAEKA